LDAFGAPLATSCPRQLRWKQPADWTTPHTTETLIIDTSIPPNEKGVEGIRRLANPGFFKETSLTRKMIGGTVKSSVTCCWPAKAPTKTVQGVSQVPNMYRSEKRKEKKIKMEERKPVKQAESSFC